MEKNLVISHIPTQLTEAQFALIVLPHLMVGLRGPNKKLPLFSLFNYILKCLYLGCQWKELPIKMDSNGRPEIHYTTVYRAFRQWSASGCFDLIFFESVFMLMRADRLDLSIIHGDGTRTMAKKGGDNVGFSGHKHFKGDKVEAFCDRNCNVIAPFVSAAGNRNESPLLRDALSKVKQIAKAIGFELKGSIVSLDGAYDGKKNRKLIFNSGMTPNINPNPRGRKTPKRGRKPIFNPEIYRERFNTIERVFGWEDKFRRLLVRFERISQLHYAFKTLAYTMINLRHFCLNYNTAQFIEFTPGRRTSVLPRIGHLFRNSNRIRVKIGQRQ